MYLFLPLAESKFPRADLLGTELAKLDEILQRPLTNWMATTIDSIGHNLGKTHAQFSVHPRSAWRSLDT